MSRVRWTDAVGLGLVLWLGLGACRNQGPPAEVSSHDTRIADFQGQIDAFFNDLPRWESWFAEVERLDRDNYVADIHLRARSGAVLYDAELMERDRQPGQPDGPLATILAFARELESLDIDLLVVPVPPRRTTYPELVGISTPLTPGQQPPLPDGYLRQFYVTLERNGVEVLDLQPVFLERRFNTIEGPPGQPGPYLELLFRVQDTHWTTYGASVAAEALAARIRDYPWYEDLQSRFGRAVLVEEDRWVTRRGGIARLLVNSGHLDPDTPGELLLDRHVGIAGEQWSRDDPTSPILLMGDSFFATARGFPNQLLKELGFRSDVIAVPGGVPGNLEVLRLRDEGLAGKKLVVFEFVSFSLAARDWRIVEVLGWRGGESVVWRARPWPTERLVT